MASFESAAGRAPCAPRARASPGTGRSRSARSRPLRHRPRRARHRPDAPTRSGARHADPIQHQQQAADSGGSVRARRRGRPGPRAPPRRPRRAGRWTSIAMRSRRSRGRAAEQGATRWSPRSRRGLALEQGRGVLARLDGTVDQRGPPRRAGRDGDRAARRTGRGAPTAGRRSSADRDDRWAATGRRPGARRRRATASAAAAASSPGGPCSSAVRRASGSDASVAKNRASWPSSRASSRRRNSSGRDGGAPTRVVHGVRSSPRYRSSRRSCGSGPARPGRTTPAIRARSGPAAAVQLASHSRSPAPDSSAGRPPAGRRGS